ncbi:fucolectin-1-like [Asterias rubens]|uniref:fucolectin-1-like n=1 Tax=Asterias rubens TaxID=7604 RepID=UPI001455D52B|nr:fucolectin-1-like [Asterias rubens]
MGQCERMLEEKNLLILLFGIILLFYPLSCQCLNNLTVLNLQGKQATQVSTTDYEGIHLSADLAIDGDQGTMPEDVTCTHNQGDLHPWWKVDLGVNHCLGRVTLVNRGDCCSERLSGATVRAGIESDISINAACGLPVTSVQASILGGHIPILCDPPVIARYVSVDVLDGTYLTLCEVLVEEYPIEDCLHNITTAMTQDTPFTVTSMVSSLLFDGKCIVDPRPLSVVHMKSLTRCFQQCLKMNKGCWSFDYVMTSGQCRLYDVKADALGADDEPGCKVYVVVSLWIK